MPSQSQSPSCPSQAQQKARHLGLPASRAHLRARPGPNLPPPLHPGLGRHRAGARHAEEALPLHPPQLARPP